MTTTGVGADGAGTEEERKVSRGPGLLTGVAPKRALQRVFGNSGGDGNSRRPPEGRGLPLARLACRALLPSVALGGFASAAAAAAAAAATTTTGAGGAAASLAPLLTNRWWVR